MPLDTAVFDVARHLTCPEDQAELIAEAFETGDPATIRHAVNIVARARGMASVARADGMTREGLYKTLGPDGEPQFSTMLGVLAALGMRLSAAIAQEKT